MESLQRPSKEQIKMAHDHFFNSGMTLPKLRDSALADRLLPFMGESTQITGRSIAWKLFLFLEEPLQSTTPLRSTTILDHLCISRQSYVQHLCRHMRAPDGSYPEGFMPPGSLTVVQPPKVTNNLETNNPLSLHKENPWKEWFASVELRKTILQDVERTFPEIDFFRDPEVHHQLSNILFLYSVMNSSIGYRQGMHEILAPLYYAVDYDSIQENGTSGIHDMEQICSSSWVAADAWALFDKVMRGLSKCYEWREPPLNLSPRGNLPSFTSHVNISARANPLEIKAYVAPIVGICNRMQAELLQAVDPVLFRHMQATGIEPQIYGIRWLRLLFTREFSMIDSLKLWDSLFASDPSLELAQWVCISMLIRIRNELITADYSTQLTILLRYPSPRSLPTFTGAPHHATLLVRQALALQMSPTPSAGASLILENRNLLNIPAEPTTPSNLLQRARSPHNRVATTYSPSASSSYERHTTSPKPASPEVLTRGWLGQGENLGISGSLMSAVSEITRNIPDLAASAASLVRSPNSPYSVFPMVDERSAEERPQWDRTETKQEVAQDRTRNKRLGQSLTWIVDALLQDEGEAHDPERLKIRRRAALESLSYIRDVLVGNVNELEEDRLTEPEPETKNVGHMLQPQYNLAVAVPRPVVIPAVESRQRLPRQPLEPKAVLSDPQTDLTKRSANHTHHSKSSFSGLNPSLPVENLPRPPPSSSQRWVSSRETGPNPSPHGQKLQQDPLGVL